MIAGLILAAGESSRMGKDKALLAYHGGSFLETAIATLRSAGVAPIVAVLGHHAEEIRRRTHLEDVQVVVNEYYSLGQTSSLQAGSRAAANSETEAIVLWLVDHPAVTAETVRELIRQFRESYAPLVIPRYKGERGHPVLIARTLFKELLQLPPGEGANTVIRKHRDETRWVEVDDPGVRLDIDDPGAYLRLGH
jgi:molybdenum cofactor cytidylyltransferase